MVVPPSLRVLCSFLLALMVSFGRGDGETDEQRRQREADLSSYVVSSMVASGKERGDKELNSEGVELDEHELEQMKQVMQEWGPIFRDAVSFIGAEHNGATDAAALEEAKADGNCLANYWQNFPFFVRNSGAGSKVAWQKLRREDGDIGGLEFDWFHKFDNGVKQQQDCTRSEGRYYGVDVSFDAGSVAASPQLTEFFDRVGAIGDSMRFAVGVCAPVACGPGQIERVAFFIVMAVSWSLPFALVRNSWSKLQVEELAHWNDLCLDFVVAGFPKCGTSTLSNNLHGHPGVLMDGLDSDVHWREEDFFWRTGEWFLPPLSLVKEWNAAEGRCEQQALGRKVGIKGPKYIYSELIMRALASMDVKIVLMTRDPIDFLESSYHEEFYPADKNSEDSNDGFGEVPLLTEIALQDEPLVGSARGLKLHDSITDPSYFTLQRRMGKFSEYIRRAFEYIHADRLMLLHMDHLAQDTRAVVDRVGRFVGAGELPSSRPVISVVNRSPPHLRRQDICTDKSVLKSLKSYYEQEYELLMIGLAATGEFIPPRLALKLSRCDGYQIPVPKGIRP